ncbi:MAG: ABC transporter ATP-binding protein [Chromatiales bacterium]|nr:ABC transporter ATP-binding protein [Chromatiales bacterium]
MQHLLELSNIGCRFDHNTVVDGLTLHMAPGSLNCLLGPSGCGKTTVLRAIAGFQQLHQGEIHLAGELVSSKDYLLAPEKRGLGMVFQDYALFPHLSVADNISFGLRNGDATQRKARIGRLLELVGLEGFDQRFPHELSGGQQQRVALARALAPEPKLLLLDEPFSNLDVDLRERLATDVRSILKAEGTAAVFVTHDQHEAYVMGEQIAVMNQGKLMQWDTPFNLYHEPVNRFVADFVGQGRLLHGKLIEPEQVETPLGRVVGNRAYSWPKDCRVEVLLRPDDVVIDPNSGYQAEVIGRAFRGAETLYTLQVNPGVEVLSLMPSSQDYLLGDKVGVKLDVEHLVVFQA